LQHIASSEGHLSVVAFLLERNANVHARFLALAN
jgi:ankyrin repeat protein